MLQAGRGRGRLTAPTALGGVGQGTLLSVTRNSGAARRVGRTCLALTFIAVTGCASSDEPDSGPPESAGGDQLLGHVHALGVDPADDTLYVAAHFGVFRVEDGERELVADRQQDTMGFAVVGEGHFLGSGHPDPDENRPPSLGLIESTDAGETWEPVSLTGEADLHSIEPVGDKTYAYDATSRALMVTEDRQRWDVISQLLPLFDLAVDPDDPDSVYATAAGGQLLRSTDGAELSPVYDAPPLNAIDWEPDGPLVGVAADGTVVVSADGESDWQDVGKIDGVVTALDVIPGRWHAATETRIYESTDDGATWDVVLKAEG